MKELGWWLLAKITVNANDIGVPKSTANVSVAATNAVKLLIGVAGMVAIVFLIAGGVQMAASNGDAKRVQQARETITYAVVGIVIVIMAIAVVLFVTGAITNTLKL